jgi:hypothetical protein
MALTPIARRTRSRAPRLAADVREIRPGELVPAEDLKPPSRRSESVNLPKFLGSQTAGKRNPTVTQGCKRTELLNHNLHTFRAMPLHVRLMNRSVDAVCS